MEDLMDVDPVTWMADVIGAAGMAAGDTGADNTEMDNNKAAASKADVIGGLHRVVDKVVDNRAAKKGAGSKADITGAPHKVAGSRAVASITVLLRKAAPVDRVMDSRAGLFHKVAKVADNNRAAVSITVLPRKAGKVGRVVDKVMDKRADRAVFRRPEPMPKA